METETKEVDTWPELRRLRLTVTTGHRTEVETEAQQAGVEPVGLRTQVRRSPAEPQGWRDEAQTEKLNIIVEAGDDQGRARGRRECKNGNQSLILMR